MKNYQITPERKAHLYAMMAWSDQYTKEQAEEIAYTTELQQLNNITWAEDSISTAISGIINAIESNELIIPTNNTPEEWDIIVRILADIHNKWVQSNAKKYDRGNEAKSKKNLFQHLPTELIGIDELSKDLMFLAPFLEELGLNAGKMNLVPYGSFQPSKELVEAYDRYIEIAKQIYKIETIEDLSKYIKECVNGEYYALDVIDETSKKRVDYMNKNIQTLVNSVLDKNPGSFGGSVLSNL